LDNRIADRFVIFSDVRELRNLKSAYKPTDGTLATILIVDDEVLIREALRRFLEIQGHTVLEAGDGVDALAVLNEQEVDLAVVDLVMPRMDGMGLLSRMRADYPSTKVVIVSGYDEVFDMAQREIDVVAIVSKPFQLSEVADAVRAALDES
jgi:YesN/AraC family two-component response regulator